eukprot:31235-Pelagococcus_subviridis.AAC.14
MRLDLHPRPDEKVAPPSHRRGEDDARGLVVEMRQRARFVARGGVRDGDARDARDEDEEERRVERASARASESAARLRVWCGGAVEDPVDAAVRPRPSRVAVRLRHRSRRARRRGARPSLFLRRYVRVMR